MTAARATLVAARRKRPAPHLDDKVLTSWNGLMASGLQRGHGDGFVPECCTSRFASRTLTALFLRFVTTMVGWVMLWSDFGRK